MEERKVFVSVGPVTPQQEAFVRAIEERLRIEGFAPHTVNRNTFTNEAPLKAVTQLMSECCGTVVIALERSYFPAGVYKRGGADQKNLTDVKLPTPWNQIEASMAYSLGLPLLVVVESGLKNEGLLEKGYDWYVLEVSPDPAVLASAQFNGIMGTWKTKAQSFTPRSAALANSPSTTASSESAKDIKEMSILQIFGSLKPAEFWSALAAFAAVIAGAFAIGAKFAGK